MNFDNFFLIFLILLFLFLFFSKFKILSDNISFSNHKKIGIKNKSPIILGGIYLLIIVLLFYPNDLVEIKIIFFLMVLLGLMSDKNILPNLGWQETKSLTYKRASEILELKSKVNNDKISIIFRVYPAK